MPLASTEVDLSQTPPHIKIPYRATTRTLMVSIPSDLGSLDRTYGGPYCTKYPDGNNE